MATIRTSHCSDGHCGRQTGARLVVSIVVALGIVALPTYRAVRQMRLNWMLIYAVRHQNADAVKELLQEGASANAREDAVRPGLLATLRYLLFRPHANPPARTALEIAVEDILPQPSANLGDGWRLARTRLLSLDELRGWRGNTAEEQAYPAKARICAYLLDAGADFRTPTVPCVARQNAVRSTWPTVLYSESLLSTALYTGSPHIVHALLAHGARFRPGEERGALLPAVYTCRYEDVIQILKLGATTAERGHLPLEVALEIGRWRLARGLLPLYGGANLYDSNFGSPLHLVNWMLRYGKIGETEREELIHLRQALLSAGGKDANSSPWSVFAGKWVESSHMNWKFFQWFYLERRWQPDTVD